MPRDYTEDGRVTTVWKGEELEVSFSAKPIRTDYGVPHSPTWIELEDITIDLINVLGQDVDPKDLPESLVAAIHTELVDELNWN